MKLNKLYILGFYLTLTVSITSCDNKENKNINTDTSQTQSENTLKKKVNVSSINEVRLLPEANDASNEWMAFTTAKNEIERIPSFSLQEVLNNSSNIFKSVQDLQDSIPAQFQEIPIQARLNVLLTKVYLLETQANQQTVSAGKIDTLSRELYQEFNNLKIQLNEVFIKSVEDLDIELDERIRKQDSLANLQKEAITN